MTRSTLIASALRTYEAACGGRGTSAQNVLLEGSLAEGFGNDSSDLDFLVVVAADVAPPLMPEVTFAHGRRVEIRARSPRQLLDQFDRVSRGQDGQADAAYEDLLDRCQRFLGGLVLRDADGAIEAVRSAVDAGSFAAAVSGYFTDNARRALHLACTAAVFEDPHTLREWSLTCLRSATKAWLARQGETYLGRKWLHHQLRRLGNDEVRDRFLELNDRFAQAPAFGLLRAVHDYGHQLGVLRGADPDVGRVQLVRARTATTWEIGGRTHVVHRGKRLYVLNRPATRIWRGLSFNRPLRESLVGASPDARRFVHVLWRRGLIGLRWRGQENLSRGGDYGAELSAEQPLVTFLGGPVDEATTKPLANYHPLDAPDFATAGMSLVWANIMIENAREDLQGALAAGQLGVAEWSFRRIGRDLALALLSAHGVVPLPAVEEAVAMAVRNGSLPEPLRHGLAELTDAGPPPDLASARQRFAFVEELITAARERMGGSSFPRSFEANSNWHATLDIGYDWVRLGSFLLSHVPIAEARDLLSRQGARPTPPPRDDTRPVPERRSEPA